MTVVMKSLLASPSLTRTTFSISSRSTSVLSRNQRLIRNASVIAPKRQTLSRCCRLHLEKRSLSSSPPSSHPSQSPPKAKPQQQQQQQVHTSRNEILQEQVLVALQKLSKTHQFEQRPEAKQLEKMLSSNANDVDMAVVSPEARAQKQSKLHQGVWPAALVLFALLTATNVYTTNKEQIILQKKRDRLVQEYQQRQQLLQSFLGKEYSSLSASSLSNDDNNLDSFDNEKSSTRQCIERLAGRLAYETLYGPTTHLALTSSTTTSNAIDHGETTRSSEDDKKNYNWQMMFQEVKDNVQFQQLQSQFTNLIRQEFRERLQVMKDDSDNDNDKNNTQSTDSNNDETVPSAVTDLLNDLSHPYLEHNDDDKNSSSSNDSSNNNNDNGEATKRQ